MSGRNVLKDFSGMGPIERHVAAEIGEVVDLLIEAYRKGDREHCNRAQRLGFVGMCKEHIPLNEAQQTVLICLLVERAATAP